MRTCLKNVQLVKFLGLYVATGNPLPFLRITFQTLYVKPAH